MRLRHISVGRLFAEAGGDPWAVNASLQRGRPDEIASLGQAFHDAGQRTAEADAAFEEARRRFKASWNRGNGDHPINDAAEVRRATQSLGIQAAQLADTAAKLEQVAALLAEAQRAAGVVVRALEPRLEAIDYEIGEAFEFEIASLPLSPVCAAILAQSVANLEDRAVEVTAAAVHEVVHIRELYSGQLHHLTKQMRAQDGYDAAPVENLDGSEEESPERAEQDVHAALAGDQAAASRVNEVLESITAEQLAGKTPLTAEQASVLSQLQAQQHGMSVDALGEAERRLGDQRQMIANSWQLMSNPAIVFPRTELKPGARQGDETMRGGAAQLPNSVQQAFDEPFDVYIDAVGGPVLTGDPVRTITDIVMRSNPAFQTNTDLDRRMIQRAGVVMNRTFNLPPELDSSNSPLNTVIGQFVGDMLGAVAPDHPVVHDMLTGPDRDAFLQHVLQHRWEDGGKAVAALFDWTAPAVHGPEARIAGETANAYGSFIGSHEPDLLHLRGDETVGQRSPELVRAMARGLAPYIGNITGTPGAVPEFGCIPDTYGENNESGRLPIAKGIFSVLSTDRTASDYFNGLADRQAVVAESRYIQAVTSHAPDIAGYNADLHNAMTLRGLVNSGIHNAVQAEAENHQIAENAARRAEYDQSKTAYELGVKTTSAATGLIPEGGAIAGPLVGILGQAIEPGVLGPAPTDTPIPADHPLDIMSIGRADREILNAVIASGHRVEGIPLPYLIDGRIGSPDELLGRGIPVTSGAYDATLSRALAGLFTEIYGADPARYVMPDKDMILRYNAVTNDPNPLKR
ncbi:hypothetical protein [Mycobacterium asiaticum]|uniref:ESX-1 secretion-associated protein EspA/EspE-like domain-containing protein n=1 Tax=Mycobacterium asiaticum TaxID=1790 RepID=A0A1A3CTV0_MYCAS|nr:hypothetical protein [Mycobacterium asiaticum]OBI90248.1 hypothetical protein A9X01_12165 [Mycobacterium asiaticum]